MTNSGMPPARDVFFGEPRSAAEQLALEERFFRSLRMPNGTYKTTSASRLTEFDSLLIKHLDGEKELRVLDVGVASAVTTLDLLDNMERGGRNARVVALDRYVYARLKSLGSGIEVLSTINDEILQIVWGDRVRPLPQGESKIKRGALMAVMGLVGMAARAFGSVGSEVALVTAQARNHPGLELVEQDIGAPRTGWVSHFDAVRAANVLNLAYFTEAELAGMIRNISSYLKEDGLLAVCRTDEETGAHNGTIFRKDSQTGVLRSIDQLGKGSEIADIVQGSGT